MVTAIYNHYLFQNVQPLPHIICPCSLQIASPRLSKRWLPPSRGVVMFSPYNRRGKAVGFTKPNWGIQPSKLTFYHRNTWFCRSQRRPTVLTTDWSFLDGKAIRIPCISWFCAGYSRVVHIPWSWWLSPCWLSPKGGGKTMPFLPPMWEWETYHLWWWLMVYFFVLPTWKNHL